MVDGGDGPGRTGVGEEPGGPAVLGGAVIGDADGGDVVDRAAAGVAVGCNGIEPCPELIRVRQAAKPGRRDDERVLHRVGGLGRIAQQRPAVFVEGICVPVVGRCEPVGIACHDGRDNLAVAHGNTLARSFLRGESDGIVRIPTSVA